MNSALLGASETVKNRVPQAAWLSEHSFYATKRERPSLAAQDRPQIVAGCRRGRVLVGGTCEKGLVARVQTPFAQEQRAS